MKVLEKIKEMLDFCNAIGCHRALYESLEYVEKELEELQSRSCETCKYQADSNEGMWCIVLDLEIISPSFCCNRYKYKKE